MFASTKAGGMCFGIPDVCLVPAPPAPPIPTPFPNIAQCAQATGQVVSVCIENMAVLVETSKISMSSGDEAGVAGGVVSGVNMGEVSYKLTSMKVYACGKKLVMLTSMTAHNGSSANMPAGMQITPSQTKVLLGG
jgi:hypothetical protein